MTFNPGHGTSLPPIPANGQQALDLARSLSVALVILVATYLIARIASERLRHGLERTEIGTSAVLLLTRSIWIAVWGIGVFEAIYHTSGDLTPLTAFIGVVGLAASLSLQTVLQNLVAGIYLLAERPFAIGDTILVVGPAGLNHEGTVKDIQMRTTHLSSLNGELILVPNAAIFSGVITNRTAVGGYMKQVKLAFPRDRPLEDVRRTLVPIVQDLTTVLPYPTPHLRVESVAKETWTGCLSFLSSSLDGDSEVSWTIAATFPDVTVNEALPA